MNIRKLEECFVYIKNGANIKQTKGAGGFPITRIETISNDVFNEDRVGFANITDISKYQEYVLKDGDLLMSHINSPQFLGRTVVYKQKDNQTIIHGMNLLKMQVDKNILIPDYAKYFFYSNHFRLQIANIMKKSVNQASFSISDLKKLNIFVPTLEEQASIVQTLNLINTIKSLKTEVINNYDELVKSRFIELFNGYEKVKLSDIADIIMGQSPDSKSYNDDGDGLPFFQGKADYGDKYTVVRHWTNEPNKIAEENSVLMSVRAPVGPVNIANTKCCIGRGLCAINAKKELTNNEFLYNALKAMEADIASMGSGSTFKAITKNDVYGLMVPKAPLDLQNQFSEFSEKVDKSKFIVQQSLDKYQQLFDSLMQEYFG